MTTQVLWLMLFSIQLWNTRILIVVKQWELILCFQRKATKASECNGNNFQLHHLHQHQWLHGMGNFNCLPNPPQMISLQHKHMAQRFIKSWSRNLVLTSFPRVMQNSFLILELKNGLLSIPTSELPSKSKFAKCFLDSKHDPRLTTLLWPKNLHTKVLTFPFQLF